MKEERIDKWLWSVRLFKTRTQATDACKKGRVTMGDTVLKPSRTVKVGDVVSVRRPPVTFSYEILALTSGRLGAKLVADYRKDVTPQSQLDILEMAKINGFIDRRKGLGRPTKKDSRQMNQFIQETFFLEDDGDDWDDWMDELEDELEDGDTGQD